MDNYNLFDVFSKTADQLFQDVDLSPAMIYMVDTVNANALPFLATQFDVEGFKGWNLATTEKQKRELIKTDIEIKRHLGTPYAIKRALLAIGFGNVTIAEGISTGNIFYYDGTFSHDGSIVYMSSNWASFIVTIRHQDPSIITTETRKLIQDLILYYKNARSKLVELRFFSDELNYYDAHNTHDATITY